MKSSKNLNNEKNFLIAKSSTEHKMNNIIKKKTSTIPTRANMTQIKNFKNKNIYINYTTHFPNKTRWRKAGYSLCKNNFNKFTPATIKTTTHAIRTRSSHISRVSKQKSFGLTNQHLWLLLWSLVTLIHHVELLEMTTTTNPYKTKVNKSSSSPTMRYSQLLSTNGKMSMYDNKKSMDDNDDTFRPFVPKDPEMISRNVFTPSGQFRVFQPIDTDLRAVMSLQSKSQHFEKNKMSESFNAAQQTSQAHEIHHMTRNHKISKSNSSAQESIVHQKNSSNLSLTKHQTEHHNTVRRTHQIKHKHEHEHPLHYKQSRNTDDKVVQRNEAAKQDDLSSDLKSLEDLLVDYVNNFFEKGQYEPTPGLVVELQNTHSQLPSNELTNKTRKVRQTAATDAKVEIDLPRTLATGRLLFLTGLKKVLWPVFMGLQVLKSLLIAMFIPAIIGSFTKLLGKGISNGSASLFIRPMEPPQELDFRDNSLSFDADNKFLMTDEGIRDNSPYVYNQPDASQMHNEYVFDPSSPNNQLTYNRLGMNERQHQLMHDSYMNALQSIGSASFKNSGSLSSGSSGLLAPMAKKPPPAANINTFQQFQNVPDSSLLLSNYDPFYSPLLSRLDSVFAQLKINSDKEMCREKLICLMYANPAKYAPYSNLVSAQLSRELNELRKPTSDNPDILRFFKYMRAAKDGQDGVDCEKTFDKCAELKDFNNPAMVSTYHDINKLVQARKLTNK